MQKSIVNIGNRCHFHILRLFMRTFFSLLNFLSHKAKKRENNLQTMWRISFNYKYPGAEKTQGDYFPTGKKLINIKYKTNHR